MTKSTMEIGEIIQPMFRGYQVEAHSRQAIYSSISVDMLY